MAQAHKSKSPDIGRLARSTDRGQWAWLPLVLALAPLLLLGCKSQPTRKTGRQILFPTTSSGQRGEAKPVRHERPREGQVALATRPDKPSVSEAPKPFKPEYADTKISKPGHSPTQVQKPEPSPQPDPSKTSPTAGPDPVKPPSSEAKITDDKPVKDESTNGWKVTGGKVGSGK